MPYLNLFTGAGKATGERYKSAVSDGKPQSYAGLPRARAYELDYIRLDPAKLGKTTLINNIAWLDVDRENAHDQLNNQYLDMHGLFYRRAELSRKLSVLDEQSNRFQYALWQRFGTLVESRYGNQ